MNIIELHKQGESQQIECKESFGKEVAETVAAFSTASGGHILIGTGKTGQIKGITIKVFDHNIRSNTTNTRKLNSTRTPVCKGLRSVVYCLMSVV